MKAIFRKNAVVIATVMITIIGLTFATLSLTGCDNGTTGGGGGTGGETLGVEWTAVQDSTFGSSYIFAIAYGGSKFVAVGQSGKMAYSTK